MSVLGEVVEAVVDELVGIEYGSAHNHTDFSNMRLKDSIIKPKQLIDRAIELGHRGVCLTDHEAVTGHLQFLKYYQKIRDKHPDFKIGLGDEIYLVDTLPTEKFPHFIIIAKDKLGQRLVREISSCAWESMYSYKGMDRVPIMKFEMGQILADRKGHLIGSTACLGGEFAQLVLQLLQAKTQEEELDLKTKIHFFITWCVDIFGADDFYIELQPPMDTTCEQALFNRKAYDIAKAYGLKCNVTTDTHYLKKEHQSLHSAYLKATDGDREVESFYATTYLMSKEEIYERLQYSLTKEEAIEVIKNSGEIFDKIEIYDLAQDIVIPEMELPQFEVRHLFKNWYDSCPYIEKFAYSTYPQDLYFLYLVELGFTKKRLEFNEENIQRINTEMLELWEISEKLKQRMSSYYNLTRYLVDIMWSEGDSLVGIARGSVTGYFTAYLLEITQLNPIPYGLPHWRHLESGRPELPDVDIDSQKNKRQQISKAFKRVFGERNVLNILTLKTEGSKSSVQTACRGLGINRDEAQYLSDLIPFERGKSWSISDCLYGNEEEDKKPIKEFVDGINKYADLQLKEVILMIEGLVCGRSSHASGQFIYKGGYIENNNSLMKAPNGLPTTAFPMDDSTELGNLKFDMLTIEALDKIRVDMEILRDEGLITWQNTLKETYDKYLHPDVLDYNTPEMWHLLQEGSAIDIFQFNTPVGIQCAKKIKAMSLIEMMQGNSLMRLADDSDIQPIDAFVKFKADIGLWYKEMREFGLNENEIAVLEVHLRHLCGVADTQETVMEMSMDSKIANFTLKEANKLRKGIGKKKKEVLDEVREMFYSKGLENGTRMEMLDYCWNVQFKRQFGYAFSRNHTCPYSAIGLQELNLIYHYGSLFWNCAVLTVQSGALEEGVDDANEDDDEEEEDKKKNSTDYGKIAKAIGDMKHFGVNIALPNINASKFIFSPDVPNDRIIYGLKGIMKINEDDCRNIISHRPYVSLEDFMKRVPLQKGKMLSLIKSGCFDEIENKPRNVIMWDYLLKINLPDTKTKLTTANMPQIITNGILPQELAFEGRLYNYRKYVFDSKYFYKNDDKTKSKKWYIVEPNFALPFFEEHFMFEMKEGKDYDYSEHGDLIVLDKNFENKWKKKIVKLDEWLKSKEALDLVNNTPDVSKAREDWDKYCQGDLHTWTMDSVCFYDNGHQLDGCDLNAYGVVNFYDLPETPLGTEKVNKKGNKYIQFDTYTIVGTVVNRNKNNHTVDLLTPHGVVTVKYYKGAFTHYDKQVSEMVMEKGKSKKKTIEKGWFTRGTMLLINGFRRGEQFTPRAYGDGHTTMKILGRQESGLLWLQDERIRVN